MCDTIVALDSAADQGFTLFGKNSDREPDEVQNIRIFHRKRRKPDETIKCNYLTIPQTPETAKVLLCQPSPLKLGWYYSYYWRKYNKRNGIF